MTLALYPSVVKSTVETQVKESNYHLKCLIEALKLDPDSLEFGEIALAEAALQRVRSIMAGRGLLAETPKPASTKIY